MRAIYVAFFILKTLEKTFKRDNNFKHSKTVFFHLNGVLV